MNPSISGLPNTLAVLDGDTATATEWNQALEATRRLSNVVAVSMVSGVSASTSTNYTPIAGLAAQFVKYGDSDGASDLGVIMTGSCFVNTAGAKVTLGVHFEQGDSTLDVATKTMTIANSHNTIGGILRVLGLNGGPQIIKGSFKVSAGTGTANGDDSFMMLLWEIPNV